MTPNVAIAPRPLCAASWYLGRRHRGGVTGYVVRDRSGLEWRFCSPRCAMVWSGKRDQRPRPIALFDGRAAG